MDRLVVAGHRGVPGTPHLGLQQHREERGRHRTVSWLANLAWIGPFLDFGSNGYPYEGERISALILIAAAAVASIIWAAAKLTRKGVPGTRHGSSG